MRSFVYVLAFVTLTQSAFAGGGNKTPEKSSFKGFFGKIVQALTESEPAPRASQAERYQDGYQDRYKDELPPSARAAFKERMNGGSHARKDPTPQEAFFDSDELSTDTPSVREAARGSKTLIHFRDESGSGEGTNTIVKDEITQLEQSLQEDQREIARLEAVLATSRREQCRLTNLLQTCSQRMTEQERQIEEVKRSQFPRLARLEIMKSVEISSGVSDSLLSQTLIPSLKAMGAMPIFLAVGNPYQAPEPEGEGEKQLGVFFRNLPEKAFVFFDADSKAAPAIIKASAGRAILGISGVAGKTLDGARVAAITNPYLRMETILACDSITFSPDSVLGLGLQFEAGDRNLFVLTMGLPWTPGLARWSEALGPLKRHTYSWNPHGSPKNFGISYSLEKQPRILALEDRPISFLKPFNPVVHTDLDSLIRNSSHSGFREAFEFAKGLQERRLRLAAHLRNLGLSETVAFFGSGEGGPEFEDIVRETVSKVSGIIPVVTGGAGGYMLSANREAAKVPGFSIGIPMGGKKNWHEVTSTGVVHLTLSAIGYEQRIPLIFDQNTASHVLVAPGGMGTMKELATSLIALSTGSHVNPLRMVFIGSKYYGELFSWIKSLPLPAEISDRMIMN